MNWLVSALILSLSALLTLDEPPAPRPASPSSQPAQGERPRLPQGPGGGERRVSVEGAMKTMNRSLKQLKSQLAETSKRDENLALVNEMERGCVTAKGLALPKDVLERAGDEAAQAKMKQNYRAEMLTLLKSLISLEEAIGNGKADEAKKIIEEIQRQREKEHKAMGVKDDE